MLRLLYFYVSLTLSALLLSTPASAEQPLNALIVTSQGVYHNYRQQTWVLAHRIAEQANVRFDVSLAELDRWRTTDYSEGYDVLIYNICLADSQDKALIANMRRQTEVLGVPALVIHCTMHSFRDTDLWWPFVGLKTRDHEPLRSLAVIRKDDHPIVNALPEDLVLHQDELYINLAFDGRALLSSIGEDGEEHVTAWLTYPGGTPVFGTTLGHSEDTIRNPPYQRMLARALLYVTGNLAPDGTARAGMEGDAIGMDIFESFSAPEGVKFLGDEGMDCAQRQMAFAVGPCYVGCILNPFEWDEETRQCKEACQVDLPSNDEIIADCAPNA